MPDSSSAAFRAAAPDRPCTGLLLMIGDRIGRVDLQYRGGYQYVRWERGARRDFLRNRFGVGYDIQGCPLDQEMSVEFFTALGPERTEYDAVRWRMGTAWKPAKGHRLSFHLVHDREQNRRRPEHRWIFAFGYGIDLDKV